MSIRRNKRLIAHLGTSRSVETLGVSIYALILAIRNAKTSSDLQNKRDGFESYTVYHPFYCFQDLLSLIVCHILISSRSQGKLILTFHFLVQVY